MLYIENRFEARRSRTSFLFRAAKWLATAGEGSKGMFSVEGDATPFAVGSGLEGSIETVGSGGDVAGLSTREYRLTWAGACCTGGGGGGCCSSLSAVVVKDVESVSESSGSMGGAAGEEYPGPVCGTSWGCERRGDTVWFSGPVTCSTIVGANPPTNCSFSGWITLAL